MQRNDKVSYNSITTEEDNRGSRPWWKLDRISWLFLSGLVLMNIAFTLSPETLDAAVGTMQRIFDVRRWPLWYFIVVGLTGWFAYKWYEFYQGFKEDLYDKLDCVYVARYMRMNVVVGLDLWLILFCHAWGLFPHFYYVTKQWFGYNQYSNLALLLFLGFIFLAGITFYAVKQWLIAEIARRRLS